MSLPYENKMAYNALKTLRHKFSVGISKNTYISFSPKEAVKILSMIDRRIPRPKGYHAPAYEDEILSKLRG